MAGTADQRYRILGLDFDDVFDLAVSQGVDAVSNARDHTVALAREASRLMFSEVMSRPADDELRVAARLVAVIAMINGPMKGADTDSSLEVGTVSDRMDQSVAFLQPKRLHAQGG